jgi:hypothetical protein
MIKDKFAQELQWAAENVKDHTVERVCGNGPTEVWRCTNKGSSCYGFDLVISRFGIALYGDVDSLVFKVGSTYGIDFLARESVCQYMISKLEPEYYNKRELDEDALKQVLVEAGCQLLEDKFQAYYDTSTEGPEEPDEVELAEWVGGSAPITLEMVSEELKKHAPEQPHMAFENFADAVDTLLEDRAPNGLQAVESYISENSGYLNLGCEWYEHTISKYEGSLILRLEMLRICALKIQEVKNAGDGNEEHAV